ncbi:hypothetical protein LTR17_012364 [Elasticomyces elasticus]|nr:hypothetical protein LTR17_012364 [Elasticomyces elasticus]
MASISRTASARRASARRVSSHHATVHRTPIDPNDLELGPGEDPFSDSANIVVPAHLLETVSGRNEWDPDPDRQRRASESRTDTRQDFDAARIAHEQHAAAEAVEVIEVVGRPHTRATSVTMGALNRTRSGRHGSQANVLTLGGQRLPLRKTSLPTVREQASNTTIGSATTLAGSSSEAGELSQLALKHRKNLIDHPNSDTLSPLHQFSEGPFGDSMLFQKLSSYDLRGSNRNKRHSARSPMDASEVMGQPQNPFESSSYILHDEKTEDPFADDLGPLDSRTSNTLERSNTMMGRFRQFSVVQATTDAITHAAENVSAGVSNVARRTSVGNLYDQAKAKGLTFQRKPWVQKLFEYSIYVLLVLFVYFVLVGLPLWRGAVWWLYWVVQNKFVVGGTWSITIGLAAFYAYAPLIMLFEKEPPMPIDLTNIDATKTPGVHNTALMIPCYKSEKIIGPTLVAALKIFPASHIYVIANGNSPTPLDNTEEVCTKYGVNHIWSPVGSKIVAQFVGCYAAKHFENVLLIDDYCALPANFPIVSDRMKGKIQCIGYTIKSVGPESSKGTLCQQAQDLEYKISGLQRQFAGWIGSATFPHGAISLWNTKFLIKTFHTHPGFSVSEDWFFGHVARELGCRITMCSAIFVETETPTDVFFAARGGSRGGFGEMTIFKQRFYRWNFFFVNGMYYNMKYILTSRKLGFWEIGAKLFVWQEVYETLLYLLAPFVLPISLIVRPAFCGYLTAATFVLYYLNVTIFNEIHLRLRNERIGFVALYIYYAPYKIALTGINILSCYWALYKYARYFAKKHPKVIEDEKAVEVIFRLEESKESKEEQPSDLHLTQTSSRGRRMTVTAVGTRLSIATPQNLTHVELADAGIEAQDFGEKRMSSHGP